MGLDRNLPPEEIIRRSRELKRFQETPPMFPGMMGPQPAQIPNLNQVQGALQKLRKRFAPKPPKGQNR
jgi:hypothetical protein